MHSGESAPTNRNKRLRESIGSGKRSGSSSKDEAGRRSSIGKLFEGLQPALEAQVDDIQKFQEETRRHQQQTLKYQEETRRMHEESLRHQEQTEKHQQDIKDLLGNLADTLGHSMSQVAMALTELAKKQ